VSELKTLIEALLRERFGEAILEINEFRGELTVRIKREKVVSICTFLRDEPRLAFNFLSDVTAIDYLALGITPRFDVVYHLFSLTHYHRLRLKAAVPQDDPVIDSVIPVWATANFHEREVYDFFGIIFRNHPNLTRILMPEDWEGYPLRKDFPLGGVKSFYFKRSTDPHAGEPKDLIPRIRVQTEDV
jgi:NADH-quinone oxidoreductase subunit C